MEQIAADFIPYHKKGEIVNKQRLEQRNNKLPNTLDVFMVTEPDEIHPRMVKKLGKAISELLAKSLRIHREQKTLQRSEERQAENELLRKS